jgi:hypothetical protein
MVSLVGSGVGEGGGEGEEVGEGRGVGLVRVGSGPGSAQAAQRMTMVRKAICLLIGSTPSMRVLLFLIFGSQAHRRLPRERVRF